MAFRILQTRLEWKPEAEEPASHEILVIPANDRLWMLSGPGLEIKKRFGKEIEAEAARQGPVAPGEIVSTPGGKTGYTRLYHAVVMGQDQHWIPGAGEHAIVAACVQADREKAASMVVHPLYRGVHGKREAAAQEMLAGFLSSLEKGTTLRVVSILWGQPDEKEMLHQMFLHLLGHSRI